jgi:hypothetical protein
MWLYEIAKQPKRNSARSKSITAGIAGGPMKIESLEKANLRVAKAIWPDRLTLHLRDLLSALTHQFQFSVAHGDLLLLDRSWYVTHTGLLRLARRNRCAGIDVRPATEFCDPAGSRWAFKATVFKSPKCKGFAGYGDADPSNVSSLVRGAEMRVAETRAVNRALRKAYGVGVCSVEELGSFSNQLIPASDLKQPARSNARNEPPNGNGHHPLRDQLYLLIRQHRLDPTLVKLYATDYCQVSELRQANREQLATFISHLAESAQRDRDALLCELNSFVPKPTTPVAETSGEGPKAAGVA